MTQPDTNLPPNDYDEIDLRDIFRTLGKWKKTIAGVTVLCMLLSAAYSAFILDTVYEARVLVVSTTANLPNQSNSPNYIIRDDGFSDNVDEIVKQAQIDVNHYKVALTSDYVLQRTIDSLQLSATTSRLKGQIRVEDVKNASAASEGAVSEVVVQSTNPDEAARIANCLAQETNQYLNEMSQQKVSKLLENLEAQQKIALQELDQAFADLNQYHLQNSNVNPINDLEGGKLQNEVKLRKDMVKSLSSKILQVKVLYSVEPSEDKLVVLSAATVPETPVQPNKTLNIAIAGVLGLIASIFGVFLIEYLRQEDGTV